ncbi:hypothetical protein [Parvularcula sp. IMCC14364]|uniref:hypothetical protein n=1 Tax=Parvularcula sp. IMCC14364 TaxID=3067902 RepID=UPI0027429797|nr:hypothetical protein [Parvularcula sp. IMCC14364]
MSVFKSIAMTSFVLLLAGCVTPAPSRPVADVPVAGPGETAPAVSARAPRMTDCDRVIPIMARNTAEGIAKEDQWIARNYPGSQTIARRLTQCNGKQAEVITLRDRNGLDVMVTFDISSFFGKTSTGDDLDDLLDG